MRDKDINIFILDLPSQRMKSSLKFNSIESVTENSKESKDQSPGLPTYAVALIAIGSTTVLAIILIAIYLKFIRNKNILNNGTGSLTRMRTVWSNPDDSNMTQILLGDSNTSLKSNIKADTVKSIKSKSSISNTLNSSSKDRVFIEFKG